MSFVSGHSDTECRQSSPGDLDPTPENPRVSTVARNVKRKR